PPQLALLGFPGAVPQRALDPGDAGDEAVAVDAAQDLAGFGIDLVNLAVAILADPQRALGPGQAGGTALARCRNRRGHFAPRRVDLLDAALGDLEQVPAVEGRARMGGDVDRARRLAARRIEGGQLLAGRHPDLLAVIGNAMYMVDAGEGAIFLDDVGR